MDEVFAQSKKFFTLPMKEKMKILRNEKHRGYTPVLDELLDPENQIHGILHVYIDFDISLSLFFFIYNNKLLFTYMYLLIKSSTPIKPSA
jgi:hypothetical protein